MNSLWQFKMQKVMGKSRWTSTSIAKPKMEKNICSVFVRISKVWFIIKTGDLLLEPDETVTADYYKYQLIHLSQELEQERIYTGKVDIY